jgi:hypothetical protein
MRLLTLFRPVGPRELELIRATWQSRFPASIARTTDIYPVLTESYAVQIANDWNVKDSGVGFVTRFRVRKDFVARYQVQTVGDSTHQELWIPTKSWLRSTKT